MDLFAADMNAHFVVGPVDCSNTVLVVSRKIDSMLALVVWERMTVGVVVIVSGSDVVEVEEPIVDIAESNIAAVKEDSPWALLFDLRSGSRI